MQFRRIRKKEIELCSKYLVRELTVLGYNSRFIFSCLNKVFFLKSVNDVASLETFFSCFDSEVKGIFGDILQFIKNLRNLVDYYRKKCLKFYCYLDNNKFRRYSKDEGYSVIELKI